jgi:hypothetical protein
MSLVGIGEAELAALKTLVHEHRVTFESAPAVEPNGADLVTVGYDVLLAGAHPAHDRDALPGCSRCRAIWSDLLRLAEAVRPRDDERSSSTLPRSFDAALHTRPGVGSAERDEVLLTLCVRHRRDPFAAIDACEEVCKREIVRDLRALGAQEGRWQIPRTMGRS